MYKLILRNIDGSEFQTEAEGQVYVGSIAGNADVNCVCDGPFGYLCGPFPVVRAEIMTGFGNKVSLVFSAVM